MFDWIIAHRVRLSSMEERRVACHVNHSNSTTLFLLKLKQDTFIGDSNCSNFLEN